MTRVTVLAICFFAALAVQAQNDGQGHSIMFKESQHDRSALTTLPEGYGQDRGDKCMQMMHEVDKLKGKPQRRSVAMERYKQECEMR